MQPLPPDHPFAWANLLTEPRGDHGTVTERLTGRAVDGCPPLTWFTLYDQGGFLRLLTKRGANYFAQQNLTGHITPDWKIHFSVEHDDLPTAWNLLASLFMSMRCEFALKCTVCDASQWTTDQYGRELTVYMFVHDAAYEEASASQADPETRLGVQYERDASWWQEFVARAERMLAAHSVRTRGCAVGDLPMSGCRYASLRNEAFVDDAYPSNQLGFNAAKHPLPSLLPECGKGFVAVGIWREMTSFCRNVIGWSFPPTTNSSTEGTNHRLMDNHSSRRLSI